MGYSGLPTVMVLTKGLLMVRRTISRRVNRPLPSSSGGSSAAVAAVAAVAVVALDDEEGALVVTVVLCDTTGLAALYDVSLSGTQAVGGASSMGLEEVHPIVACLLAWLLRCYKGVKWLLFVLTLERQR